MNISFKADCIIPTRSNELTRNLTAEVNKIDDVDAKACPGYMDYSSPNTTKEEDHEIITNAAIVVAPHDKDLAEAINKILGQGTDKYIPKYYDM